ncbi:MAG: RNA polymerase sigma factor RpoD/SigA [Candidatus Latescibacteria bacterium]|jgi:RNA polymerase primary sigma factor|nr:RNA polymerase sigma factor RpoD/SigA [Candidatus Latescibacterota bacterium]
MLPRRLEWDALQRYLDDAAKSQPLSAKEERALAERIQEGDVEARAELVMANLRFVIAIARQYQGRWLPIEDLISIGNLGLISAAERFDGTRGVKFISYAVWWIRQALSEQSRIVRLPGNQVDLLRRISEFGEAQYQETASWPAPEHTARALGVPLETVQETLARNQHTLSLDAALGDEEDSASLIDVIADETEEPPDADLARRYLEEEIGTAMGCLDERETEVIGLYYGLAGREAMNLGEIGRKFGLTRERIRQIRDKALNKLRNPARARRLKPYADEL